ncbi:tyrosinase [Paenibacillus algorifonticola]|uniref:Tyrosinase n=1 Tax=Paenibacillus algorifonticola TaxID=684063 RepID=A0A1I2J207_9BACL|nr:tyrosinase family protein [Paenibacillus algorifonticola]SFF48479.1 tyrosinase [Paenibacillus algorifonticola]
MAKKRRDINDLDENHISDYIHALNILRARSEQNPDDEAGYDFQAGLHNDPFIGPCEHGNDLFLAWHRSHLNYFEKLLQEADPPRTANVTIPYWDWLHPETNGKFPAAFARPDLFMPGRNDSPTELPPDTLQIVIEEMDWNEFGGFPKEHPTRNYGKLELGPHNYMHPFYIGGRMARPSTAAEDPIYWSFHAFIDLLWAEWQRRNNMPPPTSPDADLRGFLTKPRHKVSDFQKTTDLDYEYEYTDKLNQAFGVGQPEHVRRELLTEDSLRPLFSDELNSELRRTLRAQFTLPSPPAATETAYVRLQDLKVPTIGSYMFRAYVHPKDEPFKNDNPDFQHQYGVGYVALWKSHGTDNTHGGHGDHGHDSPPAHHPSSCTVGFDVSRQLVGIIHENASELVLTLQYIPAPGPAGEPQSNPDLVKEVQLADVLLEAYIQS